MCWWVALLTAVFLTTWADGSSSNIVYGRAVQLVSPDSDHQRLQLNEESLRLLREVPAPLAVIAVVGNIHSGKSFFLNQLLGSTSGFELGYTVDPKTSGLWWWSKPLTFGKTNVLLLDTEGFAGPNVTEMYDAKLFALAMLLSSEMVYNTMKFIDQDSLDRLELLTRRANVFGLKALERESGLEGRDTLPSAPLPSTATWLQSHGGLMAQFLDCMAPTSLTWVVQDFVQDLRNYTATAWLNHLIDSSKTSNSTSSLRSLFSHLDCHVLPSPINDDHLLRKLDAVAPGELNPSYRSAMAEFRSSFIPRVASNPKMRGSDVFGNSSEAGGPSETRYMSGEDIASLLRFLVASLNSGISGSGQRSIFPDIPHVWEQFAQYQLDTVSHDLVAIYQKDMGSVYTAVPPLLDDEVAALHATVEKNLLTVWERNTAGVEHVSRTVGARLLNDIDKQREKIETHGCSRVKGYCSDLASVSLTATAKQLVELKQAMPHRVATLNNEVSVIVSNGMLRFRDSLQFDSASRAVRFQRALQTEFRDGIEGDSGDKKAPVDSEMGLEWGDYFRRSSCCRPIIVDFEQELQRQKADLELANARAIDTSFRHAIEKAKERFGQDISQPILHIPELEYHQEVAKFMGLANSTFYRLTDHLVEDNQGIRSGPVTTTKKYDEVLQRELVKMSDGAKRDWLTECDRVSQNEAHRLVHRFSANVKRRVPLPADEVELLEAIGEEKEKATTEYHRVYCLASSIWLEKKGNLEVQLEGESTKLLSRNIAEVRRLSREPLLRAKQVLQARCADYIWPPSFRDHATTITHTHLARAVALDSLTLGESLRNKVVDSFISDELGSCTRTVKFNFFAVVFRLALSTISCIAAYRAVLAWRLVQALCWSIALCIGAAQPRLSNWCATFAYWVWRVVAVVVGKAVLVSAVVMVLGAIVVRYSARYFLRQSNREVQPASPVQVRRFSYGSRGGESLQYRSDAYEFQKYNRR